MLKPRLIAGVATGGLLVSGLLIAGATPAAAATTCQVFFDVNKDKHDDIPIGSPMEDLPNGAVNSGTVTVVFGSDNGQVDPVYDGRSLSETDLGKLSNQDFTSQASDQFGFSMLTADLNGDGCGDLVVGAPRRNTGAGVVYVVYGQPIGAGAFGSVVQVLAQGTGGEGGKAEAGDHFGWSLAVTGSNDHGDPTQLWVGVPDEDIGTTKDAGLVDVYPTTPGGLLPTTGIRTRVQGPGVGSTPEAGDRFGASLDGSPHTVLVGAPGEDTTTVKDAGMFHAFVDGVATAYTAESAAVPGTSEAGDGLGSSVAIGSSCQAAKEAWIVGAPGEDVGSVKDAGNAVLLDRGTNTAITLQQGVHGLPDTAEPGDRFGATLNATGVSTNHTQPTVAVGAPWEDVSTAVDAGQVTMLATSCPGGVLGIASSTDVNIGTTGLGTLESNDLFGASLGAAKTLSGLPATGTLDYLLLIGAPNRDEDTVDGPLLRSGMVLSMPATALGFGTSGAALFGQSSGDVPGPGIPGLGQTGDSFGSALASVNSGR